MDIDQNGEPEDTMQDNRTVGDKIAAMPVEEGSSNVEMEALDESGAVEAAEYAGVDLPEGVEDETTPPEADEPQSETVVQGDKYIQELPITHLKSPVNSRVFEATPELMRRKDLVPCDEDGKKVYDHRCF